MNPHPIFEVAKLEHKAIDAPFIVTYIEFHSNPDLPDLAYGKIVFFVTHFLNLNILQRFNTSILLLITNILLSSFYSKPASPIELTDNDSFLPSDNPNITNLMVSQVFHYDLAKQHNFR